MAYMVAVCGSYLFACGKTNNMQLPQNNLSLQAIWLEVNWSMTDPIYSVSRWLIFFCCCTWYTCNCFSFFIEKNVCINVTFRIHHKMCYGKNCRMTQLSEFKYKTGISLFSLNSNFIQPSVCKYVLFVCFFCVCQTASIFYSLVF